VTWRGSEDFARETGEVLRLMRGMNRKVAITLTDGAKWQVVGQRGGQGGDETLRVEAFTGIGFYSRPPASGNPEAIATAIGGAKTLALVAQRDEATRQAVVGDLAEGETAVYNDKALIVVKADGTVEIRLAGGVALPLATKQDLQILRSAINTAVISVGAGGAATINTACDVAVAALVPPPTPPTWPIGTTQLKAQ
jgi:phage gp45-like